MSLRLIVGHGERDRFETHGRADQREGTQRVRGKDGQEEQAAGRTRSSSA